MKTFSMILSQITKHYLTLFLFKKGNATSN